MPVGDDLTPADCRALAASARRQASLANSESDRAAWIKIATEWEQIATALEEIERERPSNEPTALH